MPMYATVISWSGKNMGDQEEEKPDILEWISRTDLAELDGGIRETRKDLFYSPSDAYLGKLSHPTLTSASI